VDYSQAKTQLAQVGPTGRRQTSSLVPVVHGRGDSLSSFLHFCPNDLTLRRGRGEVSNENGFRLTRIGKDMSPILTTYQNTFGH